MASYPSTLQVNVDTERFIQTRNALTSAYIGLSSSIDTAIKAYIAHTDVVLQGHGTFDVSQLLLPFQGAAGAAQVAEQAIQNGLIQLAAQPTDANGVDSKKKEKRPYKQRDPNAPKRPLTAYFRYLREVRPFIAQEVANNPPSDGTKAGDISKIATERWRAMSDAQRKPYHAAYQSEMGAYEEATKAYKAAGGGVEDDADAEAVEGDLDSPAAQPAVAAAEDSDDSSSDDDSSSEEDSNEEESVPAKLPTPPPPPKEKKTPKAGPKKVKAAADATPAIPFNNINAGNHNIDPQLTGGAPVANMASTPNIPSPFTAPALSQASATTSKKRKAATDTPTTTEGSEKKKRGRPSKKDAAAVAAEQVAAAAQLHMPESSQPETASGAEKKKKKKRKSEAAA
ncbi:Putative High mobility group box domain-containing protein [Septoria linicola]|uniref:High mobility group box domain-containing protein n=1 Tax=Septoria linicola TaxID=215465 RepID=A0A9Q9APT8_9PEZI|nr:putative High mobility group box domain-containing protein [Septoria linicola]USW53239.1 Putative High mobility group box domain-containing protein [Septoria linicola]